MSEYVEVCGQYVGTRMTDEALCARWQAGDAWAGEELARRHWRLVRHLGRTQLIPGLDREDGEAAAFHAFAEAFNYRAGHGCRFRSYVDCVVRRKLAKARQAASRHWRPTFPLLPEHDERAPGGRNGEAELLDDIRATLADHGDAPAVGFFDQRRSGLGWAEAHASARIGPWGAVTAWRRIRAVAQEVLPMGAWHKREKTERKSHDRPLWSSANPTHQFAERCAAGHHSSGRLPRAEDGPVRRTDEGRWQG